MCQRCTTRGLICQYTHRETRPRGTHRSLRNSVSSIELRTDGTPYRLHQEGRRDYKQQDHRRPSNGNVIPYETASQWPLPSYFSRPQLQLQSHLQTDSQPSSHSGSPVYPYFSPQQLDFSPASSNDSFMFPEQSQRSGLGTSSLRRAHSQSELPHHPINPYHLAPAVPHIHHQQTRSLDISHAIAPPAVPPYFFPQSNGDDDFFYQYQYAQDDPATAPSPFSSASETSRVPSDTECVPLTPPPQSVIYNPTPNSLFQTVNVQMLDIKAGQDNAERLPQQRW